MNPRNLLPRLASNAGENQPANRRVCATETQATDTQGIGSRADSPPAAPEVIIDPEILAALHIITERLNGMSKKLDELSAVDSTLPAAATVGGDWKMPPRVDTPGPTPAEVEPEQGPKVATDKHAAKADKDATKATRKSAKQDEPDQVLTDRPQAHQAHHTPEAAESEGGTPE